MPKALSKPDGWVRDEILEADATYMNNARALCRRANQDKITPRMCSRIRWSLAMAALRRAGLSLKASEQLMHA
jgi:hypothetical protein